MKHVVLWVLKLEINFLQSLFREPNQSDILYFVVVNATLISNVENEILLVVSNGALTL